MPSTTSPQDEMAPSTLDLLVITFNCAKALINPPIFAGHLQASFSQNASSLPDLVVFSLQEVAPMSYSFIGGYFLSPYFQRFEDALNLAALQFEDDRQEVVSITRTEQPKKPYTLVRARNVGYTAILFFARDPDRLHNIQEAEVGFGAAEMGNKGAVGIRALFEGTGGKETEVTFIATHLAAMEWNLARRNANWAAIVRGMTFENPEVVIEKHREASPASSEDDNEAETAGLLHDEQHADLQRQLHDISVFKPSSHLFVAGDLNYRISTTSPPPGAAFPSLDPESENHYLSFLSRDQLTRERKANRTLHGLSEAEINFPPTYKYDIKPGSEDENPEWSFAPHRYPSWTDRVLYLDTPSPSDGSVQIVAYNAMPVVATSDHRPVFLRASVPLIEPATLARSLTGADQSDPRVRLPVEIDPEAWERRVAARRKETIVGWTSFIWSTQQGAMILGTVVAVAAGCYWFLSGAST
uniref:Inositol polyphosphate-related phosphatase domain-containing protein n=1 Tax=Bionectria ochroleuca TaxID=29856 RepID=A0A8H7NJQ4_BIOOC